MFPFLLQSQEVTQISCDEDIKLVIDEENMTNEEILKAKDKYFKKLLAQANQECISKMKKALEEYVIMGIDSTIQLNQDILDKDEFISGNYNINFMNTLS